MELKQADCPVCHGKGSNKVIGVEGDVMCFTCRGRGHMIIDVSVIKNLRSKAYRETLPPTPVKV